MANYYKHCQNYVNSVLFSKNEAHFHLNDSMNKQISIIGQKTITSFTEAFFTVHVLVLFGALLVTVEFMVPTFLRKKANQLQ